MDSYLSREQQLEYIHELGYAFENIVSFYKNIRGAIVLRIHEISENKSFLEWDYSSLDNIKLHLQSDVVKIVESYDIDCEFIVIFLAGSDKVDAYRIAGKGGRKWD